MLKGYERDGKADSYRIFRSIALLFVLAGLSAPALAQRHDDDPHDNSWQAAVAQLRAALAAEAAAREAAVAALQNNINAEAAARASADSEIVTALGTPTTSAFATFRENGDVRGDPISVPRDTFVRVGSLTVPAGNYVVMAYLWFSNEDLSSAAIAQCLLVGGIHGAQALDTVPSPPATASNRTLALTAAGTVFDGGGPIRLECRNQKSDGGNLVITTFDLNAIKVGNLTFQPWP